MESDVAEMTWAPSNSNVEHPAFRMPCIDRFFITSSSPGTGGLLSGARNL